MGKKIWLPMHPRNFDSHVTVRPIARPSAPQARQCKTTQLTGMVTQMQLKVIIGRNSHGHPEF